MDELKNQISERVHAARTSLESARAGITFTWELAGSTIEQRSRLVSLGCRPPAQRMEDLAGVHHLLEPRAALRGALDGQEQGEEAILAGRASVLAQGLTERAVLGLALLREPVGEGREKSEGRFFVAAVLRQRALHLRR